MEGSTIYSSMRWRPHPIVLFDCDSTLSAVEGIDELTDDPAKQAAVAELTDAAMDGQVPLEDVYGKRLALLNPTRTEIRSVTSRYKRSVVPDAQATIAALDHVGAESWIISGGLLEPVAEFATWLGVPQERVRAVGTEFDPLAADGWWAGTTDPHYADHDRGHLTTTTGKADVIRSAVDDGPRRMMVGDGVSDLAAAEEVDLFVGYAGVIAREAVVEEAPVVIESHSIAPVLGLAVGMERLKDLVDGPHGSVAIAALDAIDGGALRFNDESLAARFRSA